MKQFALFLLPGIILLSEFGQCQLPPPEEPSSGSGTIQLIPYRKGNKWGYSNQQGVIKIEPSYEAACPFVEDRARVMGKDTCQVNPLFGGAWGYIDTAGNEIIPLQFHDAYNFREGHAKVMKYSGGSTDYFSAVCVGFIDSEGNTVIPLQYRYIEQELFSDLPLKKNNYMHNRTTGFSNGLAMVGVKNETSNTKVGYIDQSGNQVIPFQYDMAEEFHDGKAYVQNYTDSMASYFIRADGIPIFPIENYCQGYFNDSYSVIFRRSNGSFQYGLINSRGEKVVQEQYDYLGNYCTGFPILVSINEKWGYIDTIGNIVVPIVFEDAYQFSEDGLALVESGGCYFYIDKVGNKTIPLGSLKMEQIDGKNRIFYEGLACIINDQLQYGYINTKGDTIIQPQYDMALPFSHGIAWVQIKGKYGYVGMDGRRYFED